MGGRGQLRSEVLASAEHVPSSSEDGTPHGTVGLRTGVQEVLCKGVRGRGQEQGREEMETCRVEELTS